MKAKIREYKDILLDDLVIGKAQARTQDIAKDIDDLARSIEVHGLLQPIVVCEATQSGKWEILTGQRRFLAHEILGRERITAAILDQRADEGEAKAISITENLIRRKLSGKELTDGILYLYNIYGNVKAVANTAGLPLAEVKNHVRYPRLLPKLKEMVDDQRIDIRVALKAQDAVVDDNQGSDIETAVKLASEMQSMTGAQQKKLVKEHKSYPEREIDEVIEDAKTGGRVTQVIATVTQDTHAAIRKFAHEENTNQDEAVVMLIEDALIGRGLLEQ